MVEAGFLPPRPILAYLLCEVYTTGYTRFFSGMSVFLMFIVAKKQRKKNHVYMDSPYHWQGCQMGQDKLQSL